METFGDELVIKPALNWRDMCVFKTIVKGQTQIQKKMATDTTIGMTDQEQMFAQRTRGALVELIYLQPDDDQEFTFNRDEAGHAARAIRANNYAEITEQHGHLVEQDSIIAEAALKIFENHALGQVTRKTR